MFKISDEDKKFILKHVENAETLLKGESIDDLNKLLDAIDDVIIYTMDKDGFPSKLGDEAQMVFDRVYQDN